MEGGVTMEWGAFLIGLFLGIWIGMMIGLAHKADQFWARISQELSIHLHNGEAIQFSTTVSKFELGGDDDEGDDEEDPYPDSSWSSPISRN
jgi:hypothetical protein